MQFVHVAVRITYCTAVGIQRVRTVGTVAGTVGKIVGTVGTVVVTVGTVVGTVGTYIQQ